MMISLIKNIIFGENTELKLMGPDPRCINEA